MERQKTRTVNIILKKSEVRGLTLPNLRTSTKLQESGIGEKNRYMKQNKDLRNRPTQISSTDL